MPNSGEYKSAVGLRNLYIAEVTQDDQDAYAAGTPEYLAPAITAGRDTTVNTKTQYADDQAFDAMTAEGETKISLDVTNLPGSIRARLLGGVYDAATGRVFGNGGTAPYFALSFCSLKSNGSYYYGQYLKGRFSQGGDELATKTDTPEPKPKKMVYTAIKTVHQFVLSDDITDGSKFVDGDEDDTNFDGSTWFGAVQVPVKGTPAAFTLTASPVDGATGVAVTADVVLTFSNALAGNVENGILLVRADTAAPVAVAKSIDAARKVVTLNPSSNLTAAKQYLVMLSGIRDIYGQALADTVVDFTTA